MSLFPFLRKNRFLTQDEADMIVQAILESEKKTSGEIRVFIESRCRLVNPVDRAAEVFWNLKMDHTEERNGVLVYVASKDHQVAIWGDEGVHDIAGLDYWKDEINKLMGHFKANAYADGIRLVVDDIGELLQKHFPYKATIDKNELPDDIVFGN
jgi:uncharacterized membrane protein